MSQDADNEPLDPAFILLQQLAAANVDFVLMAGQAVNFWASYYAEEEPALKAYRPFVSKDVDLLIKSEAEVLAISGIVPGKTSLSSSPLNGQFAVFVPSTRKPSRVDLFVSVLGISHHLRSKVFTRAIKASTFFVMDPILLLVAKTSNLFSLPDTSRNDRRHVQMLVLIVTRHLARLLALATEDRITERQWLDEIKFLLRFRKSASFRRGLERADRTILNCIPWKELNECELKGILRFRETTLEPLR